MTSTVMIKCVNAQTLTFQVNLKTQKVRDLRQKFAEKSGLKFEQVALVYAGKNLQPYLDKYLCEEPLFLGDMATIHGVARLKGGKTIKLVISDVNSKEYTIQIDDNKTGFQLKQHIYANLCKSLEVQAMALRYAGVLIENDKKLSYYKIDTHKGVHKVFQEKESLGNIAGIIQAYEQDQFGIDKQTTRMPCGHVIGRDGITQFIRSLILSRKYKIICPSKKTDGSNCMGEWEFYLCRKIGVFTKEEVQEFQEGLSMNWIREQTSQCPKCQFKVMKGDLKSDRVVCPKCKYGDYCLNCSKIWINSGFEICGNPQCPQLNKILASSQQTKSFNLTDKNNKIMVILTPELRACPNPKCHTIFTHDKGCKHAECFKCGMNFCWVCLEVKEQGKGWGCGQYTEYCGKVAPTQEF